MSRKDFTIIVRNGFIIDGTGNPWYKADVGITDERITKIGTISAPTKKNINAEGLIVAPGFIDIHSHSDLAVLNDPFSEPKIRQGVTTEVLGQDGLSVAPVKNEAKTLFRKFLAGLAGDLKEWNWNTLGDFLDRIERKGTAVNIVTLVGHGTIRAYVMGFKNRNPSIKELDYMKQLVEESMVEGAFGLSTGLIYAPSNYASIHELIELSKIAAKYNGIFVIHLRNEGEKIIEALKEAITIGKKARLPIHVSHHKVVGKENWGMVNETLKMIDKERKNGLDITCDQYPYTAGSTMLSALIPPWAHQGGVEKLIERLKDDEVRKKLKEDMIEGLPDWVGYPKVAGWENIRITYCNKNKDLEGKSIAEIARLRGKNPFDTTFNLLIEEDASPSMIVFHINENDMFTVMKHPCVMVSTDGLLCGKPHPRAYGTYPRILGRYVRDYQKLRLEEAIRKMTSLPAQRLNLQDRGLLKENLYADITIFNAKKIIDKSTYDDPHKYPEGIHYVIVNGKIALDKGKRNKALSGKVLRHKK